MNKMKAFFIAFSLLTILFTVSLSVIFIVLNIMDFSVVSVSVLLQTELGLILTAAIIAAMLILLGDIN